MSVCTYQTRLGEICGRCGVWSGKYMGVDTMLCDEHARLNRHHLSRVARIVFQARLMRWAIALVALFAWVMVVRLMVGVLVSGVIFVVAQYHHGLREALNICGRGGGG